MSIEATVNMIWLDLQITNLAHDLESLKEIAYVTTMPEDETRAKEIEKRLCKSLNDSQAALDDLYNLSVGCFEN
jgi:oligoribonuclease (3'-5' exoribonuclease)